jgi:CubicO group peptidase (beta-lactamase class C family)
MHKRKRLPWIIGGSVLLIAGFVVGGLGLMGLLPWQAAPPGELYEDPQGRFSMRVDPAWERVETGGRYTQFRLADPPMNLYMLVVEAGSVEAAFARAFELAGFDPALLSGGSMASSGSWQLYSHADAAGLSYGLAGQIVGANGYVFMVKATQPNVAVENAAVFAALNSVRIAGQQAIVLESFAQVEAFTQDRVDSLAGSISMALLYQDDIVYTYVYGQANPLASLAADTGTIYRHGSMTKVFTAVALMQLVERGLVDLDAWPGVYVPGFPEGWQVSVRQLLTHAACMPDEARLTDGLIARRGESLPSLEEVFADYVAANSDLACQPGRVSNYANAHYLALGRIVEEVSGQPFEAYVLEHILAPLGMDSTRFQLVEPELRYAKGQLPLAWTDTLIAQLNQYRGPGQEALILSRGQAFATMDDFRILAPWGGLLSTPSDTARFLQMHLDGGRYGGVQILQPATVAAMQAMQSSNDGSPLGFGLSWWIGEDAAGEFYYHGGGGPTIETVMRLYPDLDLGVVVMCSVNGCRADQIAEGLVSAWLHEQ